MEASKDFWYPTENDMALSNLKMAAFESEIAIRSLGRKSPFGWVDPRKVVEDMRRGASIMEIRKMPFFEIVKI